MSINLSHPELDARRKNKLILSRLHLVNWVKQNELNYEWIWVEIESHSGMNLFVKWIAENPIDYPHKVNFFYGWKEASTIVVLDAVDIANNFQVLRASFAISNDLHWIIEYSNISTARFGTWNY